MIRLRLLALSAVAAFGACSDDAAPGGDAGPGFDCDQETRDDVFVAGLKKPGEGGLVTFELVSSAPAPPSRGDNDWVIRVLDAGGQPIAGAGVKVKPPFMPDHGHPTSVRVVVTEPSSGTYQAAPVNMWMPGLFEVTIEATPPGGPTDRAVFRFCIPG